MAFQASKRSSQTESYFQQQTTSSMQVDAPGLSIIGKGLTLKDDIVCHENLTVEGAIEGTITTEQQMSVGRNGSVKADINAQNVRIEGSVNGSIKATGKVEILSGGSFCGELSSKRLVIQEGAILQAEVKMEE